MRGAKCEANAKGRPMRAAKRALNRPEPKSQMGTREPTPGDATMRPWLGLTLK